MEIRKRFHKNIVVLYISGKIDIDSALIIEETGRLLKEGIQKILCNFMNVAMIDYNGLSILAIAYKNVANQKGLMRFCNVPSHIKQLFKTTRLDKTFEIHDEEEVALKSFERSTKVDTLSLRRRFKRIDVGIPVKFKTGLSSSDKFSKGKILNLGGEGIFIHSKNTFPVSSQLYLEIDPIGKERALTVMGTVVWLADKEIQPHSYPGMGVEFANLDKKSQEDIIQFIDKNLTRRSRS